LSSSGTWKNLFLAMDSITEEHHLVISANARLFVTKEPPFEAALTPFVV
jgi:hypothetical protein